MDPVEEGGEPNAEATPTPNIVHCSACGAAINDSIPPPTGENAETTHSPREEGVPDACTVIAITGPDSDFLYLAFCHRCDRFLDILNDDDITATMANSSHSRIAVEHRNTRTPTSTDPQSVEEHGDQIHYIVSLKMFFNNMCIGDGPQNRGPYVININAVQLYLGDDAVLTLE